LKVPEGQKNGIEKGNHNGQEYDYQKNDERLALEQPPESVQVK
jgi:hypothetical protein